MSAINEASGSNWHLYHGDSCQVFQGLPDNSVGFGIHSPPFANLYIYSDSEADMGNCADIDEFIEHYKFLIPELYRTTAVGRLCAVHCKDLPKYANRDDTAGLIDFPGKIIQAFIDCEWSYHSRVTIWKCPVVERERTNNNGLLHKTIMRDRSQVRQGMADFLLVFRKAPEGTLMADEPVNQPVEVLLNDEGEEYTRSLGLSVYHGEPQYDPRQATPHPSPYSRNTLAKNDSINVWRRYAEPVWWDINQMDTLNYKAARSEDDMRHICPLQIGLIRRAVQLWSNPGDIVASPFAGVGSEGVGSLREGRKFVGCELKQEYFEHAVKELTKEENRDVERVLF